MGACEWWQSGIDLAVLIDDSVSQKAAVQLKDIGEFLRTLSPDARVAVAYASYGGVKFEQEFTTDHEKGRREFGFRMRFRGRRTAYTIRSVS